MSLDTIQQGIIEKLFGVGDLCLWKKDGTLMSNGTLAAHNVAHGDNLYAVLRALQGECPYALWYAKEYNLDISMKIIVVGKMLGLSTGIDVLIEMNADDESIDVQVYDLGMSLDAINQGFIEKFGVGGVCLWKKDGTLMSNGTLAA